MSRLTANVGLHEWNYLVFNAGTKKGISRLEGRGDLAKLRKNTAPDLIALQEHGLLPRNILTKFSLLDYQASAIPKETALLSLPREDWVFEFLSLESEQRVLPVWDRCVFSVALHKSDPAFIVVTVHLRCQKKTDQELQAQARQILQLAQDVQASKQLPAVIFGDFNFDLRRLQIQEQIQVVVHDFKRQTAIDHAVLLPFAGSRFVLQVTFPRVFPARHVDHDALFGILQAVDSSVVNERRSNTAVLYEELGDDEDEDDEDFKLSDSDEEGSDTSDGDEPGSSVNHGANLLFPTMWPIYELRGSQEKVIALQPLQLDANLMTSSVTQVYVVGGRFSGFVRETRGPFKLDTTLKVHWVGSTPILWLASNPKLHNLIAILRGEHAGQVFFAAWSDGDTDISPFYVRRACDRQRQHVYVLREALCNGYKALQDIQSGESLWLKEKVVAIAVSSSC